MESVKQYLVIYEDWSGEIETTLMVTAMPVEVGLKALGIGRVLVCEEMGDDPESADRAGVVVPGASPGILVGGSRGETLEGVPAGGE
jgi:hypothetical protein